MCVLLVKPTMKCSFVSILLFLGTSTLGADQAVREDLYIKHLPDARTVGHFQFSVTWDTHPLTFAQDFKGESVY